MKIALIGYGKMGKAIEEIALERGHKIMLKIDLENIADFNAENLAKCTVAIEFTNPETAFGNVMKCLENKVATVCGTTGWNDKTIEAEHFCNEKNTALLVASNFSIGVNIFFEINKKLAQLMNSRKEYDVTIEEIHHTQKKDKPSGTAITLAEQILVNCSNKNRWVSEKQSGSKDLLIISQRQDPAAGTHIVTYRSEVDDIEIKHTAHNRKGFALGAVLAAEFIYKKQGVFTMKDVLNTSL
jgi:4-hydroxy-tetrahydrodipicolinate reductase